MSGTIESMRKPKRKYELDSREGRENHTQTMTLPGADESLDEVREDRITQADAAMRMKDFDEIAFLEEPVKIILNRSHEKNFAPRCTDYIAIQGIPVDILTNRGWVKVGFLERGVPIIIRRKFVEVLARAHQESFQTEVIQPVNEDPITKVTSTRAYTLPFHLVEDRNHEHGPEWFEKLMAQQI